MSESEEDTEEAELSVLDDGNADNVDNGVNYDNEEAIQEDEGTDNVQGQGPAAASSHQNGPMPRKRRRRARRGEEMSGGEAAEPPQEVHAGIRGPGGVGDPQVIGNPQQQRLYTGGLMAHVDLQSAAPVPNVFIPFILETWSGCSDQRSNIAGNSQAGYEDVVVQSQFTDDAIWICREALLSCFDSETRGTWRLVCKRACQAVEAATRCLKWDGYTNRKNGQPDMTVLHRCTVLERVCMLRAPNSVGLAGLPPSLRGLEVQLRFDSDESDDSDESGVSDDSDLTTGVEGLTDLTMSAALSALSALTQLEETVLHNFPGTSLPSLEFCPALRSLQLDSWLSLTDVSALSAYSNLHNLDMSGCERLKDITALSACSNLHTLDLSGCRFLEDLRALSACSSLQTLHLNNLVRLQDITALSGCCNMHTLKLRRCEQLQDITALSACSSLHTLDLYYCQQLQDITALSGCGNLHTLDLSFCEQLQDITAVSGCENLHTLDLSY